MLATRRAPAITGGLRYHAPAGARRTSTRAPVVSRRLRKLSASARETECLKVSGSEPTSVSRSRSSLPVCSRSSRMRAIGLAPAPTRTTSHETASTLGSRRLAAGTGTPAEVASCGDARPDSQDAGRRDGGSRGDGPRGRRGGRARHHTVQAAAPVRARPQPRERRREPEERAQEEEKLPGDGEAPRLPGVLQRIAHRDLRGEIEGEHLVVRERTEEPTKKTPRRFTIVRDPRIEPEIDERAVHAIGIGGHDGLRD